MRGKFRLSSRIYLDNSQGFCTLLYPSKQILASQSATVEHDQKSTIFEFVDSTPRSVHHETHTQLLSVMSTVTCFDFDTSFGRLISPSQKSVQPVLFRTKSIGCSATCLLCVARACYKQRAAHATDSKDSNDSKDSEVAGPIFGCIQAPFQVVENDLRTPD